MRGTSSSPARLTRTGNHPSGHIYTGYYAVMAQKYWQVFGKAEDSFRRTLAEISVKHHGYARFNPFAQAPMKITVEDVLKSPGSRRSAEGPGCLPHERWRCLRHHLRRRHGNEADKELQEQAPANLGDGRFAYPAACRQAGHGDTASSQRDSGPVQESWQKNSPVVSVIPVLPDSSPPEWPPGTHTA